LNDYLADIEEQAQERFERIVEKMKRAQGITEQLKAENQMEWVARMNNIQSCAREIVNKEIIYYGNYMPDARHLPGDPDLRSRLPESASCLHE